MPLGNANELRRVGQAFAVEVQETEQHPFARRQATERHVERHQQAEEIVAAGFDAETVARVLRLVRLAEFKRKQAAPGLKVTDRAFGTGWRMPIAARPP